MQMLPSLPTEPYARAGISTCCCTRQPHPMSGMQIRQARLGQVVRDSEQTNQSESGTSVATPAISLRANELCLSLGAASILLGCWEPYLSIKHQLGPWVCRTGNSSAVASTFGSCTLVLLIPDPSFPLISGL